MDLDLVDRRDDLGLLQELSQHLRHEVADADRADLSLGVELLQSAVRTQCALEVAGERLVGPATTASGVSSHSNDFECSMTFGSSAGLGSVCSVIGLLGWMLRQSADRAAAGGRSRRGYRGDGGVALFCQELLESAGVPLLPAGTYTTDHAEVSTDRFRIGVGRLDPAPALAALDDFLTSDLDDYRANKSEPEP